MTKTKSRLAEVKDTIGVDSASVKDGVYTIRLGFFYTSGRTAEALVAVVKQKFPEAKIVASGEVWKPFRGGAPLVKQSHWFVKFTL